MFHNILKQFFAPNINIILLGCDGLGETYMDIYLDNLPNIYFLIKNGCRSYQARCRQPSISAPNWSTILTGQPPEESGINNNDWTPEYTDPVTYGQLELPPVSGNNKIPETTWQMIKKQNDKLTTGSIFSWSWIKYLTDETVDTIIDTHGNDKNTKESVFDMINAKNLPNYLFIHLGEIDDAGHQNGWGSKQYFEAIQSIDEFIGELLENIKKNNYENNTILIMTSDHGGWQHSHDYFNQDCFYIPIIFYGPGIKKNHIIDHYVNNLMIAPTILKLLGLDKGKYMVSNPINDIIA